MLAESPLHNFLDQIVADQLPGADASLHARGKFGVLLNVPAEDIANADVDEIEVIAEQFRLCALATPLHAHEDILVHCHPLLRTSCLLFVNPFYFRSSASADLGDTELNTMRQVAPLEILAGSRDRSRCYVTNVAINAETSPDRSERPADNAETPVA